MPPKINYSPFENLQWQPVPVFNIPRETDTIIIQRRDCPRYDIEKEKQLNSDEIRKHEEANFEFYEYLSFHTSENISSFAEAEYLHNSLDAMDKAGWTLPEWTKSVYPEKTREVCARYLRFLTESDFMKKARGGPLLTEIMNSMMGKSQNLNEKSIAIYSGHDVTLVNIMNTLNILNQTDQVPKFSASLVIELHEKSAVEEEMTVRVFYFKNEQDANPTRVQISGCDSPCYLSTFKNIYKDFLVSDFDEMCKI
jgi:lysosomal acid phosphatase